MTRSSLKQFLAGTIFIFTLTLIACGLDLGPVSVPTPTPPMTPAPTGTLLPVVVSVNAEDITVAEFEAELARYQQAHTSLGDNASQETATQTVLNDIINSLLLEQAAAAYGFVVDDATVQDRIDALAALVGGPDALAVWESTHGYTGTDFRSTLRRQIAAAWMRDQITASVSTTAEQVHVKQILLYNADDAQQGLGYLQAGLNFEELAAQYDPVTKGELGWFPRGYLPALVIEEAAFALQPGQYSPNIQDETGYHILYVVERDPARLLSPDALLILQERALQSWLTQRRNESTILYGP